MTSAEIIARLRDRYQLSDGWVTMSEVTPPGTSRRFDFMAIQGWQSRGRVSMGFEVKVSRSDWLRELKEVAKAEPLVPLCTHWWVVAPPDVVKLEEMPATWGLLTVHAEQMRAAKQAATLAPELWSQEVWQCMLLRLASRTSAADEEIQLAVRKAKKEAEETFGSRSRRNYQHETEEHQRLKGEVEAFTKATGLELGHWRKGDGLELAQLVAHVQTLQSYEVRRQVGHVVTSLEHILESARKVTAEIAQLAPAESDT